MFFVLIQMSEEKEDLDLFCKTKEAVTYTRHHSCDRIESVYF